jgi:glycosyltransferase involved in cell wall biosynthesis
MDNPLVSVICLCYNQASFVREAVLSVIRQTYRDIELIIIDDASTDNSVEVISDVLKSHPSIKFIPLKKNVGNCKAFNMGYRLSRGQYLIDLAADDVLLPARIERGVQVLAAAGPPFGVNFSDAEWIDSAGKLLQIHSRRFPHHTIPQGDIYKSVIERFFICSPTVMFTRAVMEELGGYDEELLYEDFDFWIRSSRKFFYCYTPEVLVKKRVVKNSMAERQFSLFSPQQYSTFRICEKILKLNRNREEQKALNSRVKYEIRVTLRLLMIGLAWKYVKLWRANSRLRYS